MNPSFRKILVVNVNWLGDIIFSSPVFTNLRQAYPQAKIVALAVPRVSEVLRLVPGVDEVMIYDEAGCDAGPIGFGRMLARIRREKFDAVFYIHNSRIRAWLGFLAGIPVRVGYDVKGRGILLTHKFPDPGDSVHRSDRYVNVIQRFGVPVVSRENVLKVSQTDRDFVRSLFQREGIAPEDFKVAVNLGGNWNLKQWPTERFAVLIQRLSENPRVKVIIPGAEKDTVLARDVCARASIHPVVLTGQTGLGQLAALLASVDLVISADSGPLHIANAVGTKVIGLFGPTSPENTGPRGGAQVVVLKLDVGCNRLACYHLDCPDNICMRAVTVEDVVAAVAKFN